MKKYEVRNERRVISHFSFLTSHLKESIRVVVADDSPFICRLLKKYLESDPDISVIEMAYNGKEAIDHVKTLRPDVLTLDLNMPVLNGLDALKEIMTECPTSVVLITGVSKEAAQMTEQGLSLGAVDFIFKYSPKSAVSPESLRREIVAKVKAASRIKVIRSIPSIHLRDRKQRTQETGYFHENINIQETVPGDMDSIVVIGASTGGPLALKDLLSSIAETNKTFNFALVIVQHMPERFTGILADQFDRIFPFPVREARDGEALKPGIVLIAPGDRHLLVLPDKTVKITMTQEIKGCRPSVDVAMQSAAQAFGSNTTGVILSGMGDDGTKGLLAVKNNCGITYAQSKDTCVVDSMPYSAIEKKIVQWVGSPSEIGRWLIEGGSRHWPFVTYKGAGMVH
ncbi:MAG: chemotaxis-specific protein-glutamate methyltransferase CheB [Desulfobacteraceae bacterium]|nr:chemotaxis-specific protein-glutamate methyltransferase CheB [Desulfobacteraceae bacterium]